ncbi:MAG TPA: sulfatase [Solirubrobacterales bacterium]|nr:sulfatase [Solirubrobacterales bacterium]
MAGAQAAVGAAPAGVAPAAAGAQVTGGGQPNVVLIQTDDQAYDDLYAKFREPDGGERPVMPATLNHIGRRGITFSNHYVPYPTCCPARAALLSGRYNRNNGVLGNVAPDGGWLAFRSLPIMHHNLAPWLQDAGYRTIHIGKFLNQYGREKRPATLVPPGWTEWQTLATERSNRMFYGYRVNVNGEIRGPFGDPNHGNFSGVDPANCLRGVEPENPWCNHQTDQVTRRAVDQVKVSAALDRPFYMQVDYIAPHGDHRPPIGPEPTPRTYGMADHTPVPRTLSYNERDLSDKPRFIRERLPRLGANERRRMRVEYQRTLESLRDVDDGVREIMRALGRAGVLGRTYVIFTSDNGFFRGQHRLARGKILPYEPSARVPLLIRGPGIKPGSVTRELTAIIDLAPTFVRLAGARPTLPVDGRPLVRFWEDPDRRTRRPILLESFAGTGDLEPEERRQFSNSGAFANYTGVRLGDYKLIRYETGELELYDLAEDPEEMHSRHRSRAYRSVRRFLLEELERLERCSGKECRRRSGPLPYAGKPRAALRWAG